MLGIRNIFEFWEITPDGISRARVRMRNIVRLGFTNEKLFTKAGTFKAFNKVGYVDVVYKRGDESKRFILSKYAIRDYLKQVEKYVTMVEKETVSDIRNAKKIDAINWHYVFSSLPEIAYSDIKDDILN